MITSLSIENFALIEKLSIRFSNGFTIITGETGAGKSILLGALGLVLGKRADLSSLKNKEEKCIIEASFKLDKYNLRSFFETNDLDYEDETIIRREILPSGKSRAFINDTPVNLQELQELGRYLIDIHSQHQTQELSEDEVQFRIVDLVGGNAEGLQLYVLKLKDYKKASSTLKDKKEQLTAVLKERDYNSFLLEELFSANLIEDEQEELELQYKKLSNVEFIKENLSKAIAIADDEQFGVLIGLKEIKSALQKNAAISAESSNLFERIASVLIEFDDVQKELVSLSELTLSDPEELERVNQKLKLIYDLQKKHQVNSITELIAIRESLNDKVVSVLNIENEILSLEKELVVLEKELNLFAASLHENRQKAIPVLTEKMLAILHDLGMANARFDIQLIAKTDFQSNGKDDISFLFSANKGGDFGLLKKVASGGEMSRIMLAVKSILAEYSNLPTIIFDEIDTGVSGEIADKMGDIMRKMSQNMQVFAITHLPQIAAKGSDHFEVYKVVDTEQTRTELRLLSNEQRIQEIAKMLSGANVSESALNHAKELLN